MCVLSWWRHTKLQSHITQENGYHVDIPLAERLCVGVKVGGVVVCAFNSNRSTSHFGFRSEVCLNMYSTWTQHRMPVLCVRARVYAQRRV